MKLKIRTKLLAGFLLVIIITAVVQYITLENLIQSLTQKTGQILEEKASNGLSLLQTFNAQNRLQLLKLSESFIEISTEPTSSELDEFSKRIEDIMSLNSYLDRISILNLNGKELVRVDRYSKSTPYSDLNYLIPTNEFTEATEGTTAYSKVYSISKSETPQFDMYFPIQTATKTIGVIKAQFSLESLWDLIAEIKAGTSGFAYVIDDEGRIIAYPNPEVVQRATLINTLPIFTHLSNNTQKDDDQSNYFLYSNKDDQPVIASGVKTNELNWSVIVEQNQEEALSQINRQVTVIYTTVAITVLLLSIIARAFSNNITASIRKLREAVHTFKEGDLSTHVTISSGDEVEDLADAFNRMVHLIAEKIILLENQKKQLEHDAITLVQNDKTLHAVNEKLEAERTALVAERNKFLVTIQGINDAVIAVDLSGNITIFNGAAERLTGYLGDEIINHKMDQYITLTSSTGEIIPQDKYAPIRTDDFEGTVFIEKSLSLTTKSRDNAFVDVTSAKISESSTSNLACIITIHDVTEERQLQEMQLDFVSMAAHELRTPLTSIRGYLEMLKETVWKKLDDDDKSFISRIEISTQQLNGLMENLLSASRIEKGIYALQKQPTNWLDNVEQAVENAKPLANEKKIEYRVEKTQKTNSTCLC